MFRHSEVETLPLIVEMESGLLPQKGTDLHTKVKKRFFSAASPGLVFIALQKQ